MPRCLNCKEKFVQYQFNNKFCKELDCQVQKGLYLVDKQQQQKLKDINKDVRERKEKLKTTSDYLKELQVVFNKWVRLRDKGLNCISCNKPAKKENAGHYRSVGSSPNLRFEPLNVHLQCEYCNTYQHGNLIPYRQNLIKKIGIDLVEWLETEHEPKHYSKPELIIMKEEYKEKIKQLNK
mgnify:CR=1 FL=1|tara:strand:- start:684 stop:1223 length:540 start_codon:yes stop_codon:yes gene_type:complete